MKDKIPMSDGIIVGPASSYTGEMIFAEIVPSTSLFIKSHRFPYVQTGRTLRQPHIRWWYEIMYLPKKKDKTFNVHMWTHAIEHDGGGMTLRQTISKARNSIDELIEELCNEEKK